VLLLGDTTVGKTCIVRRYCKKTFAKSYSDTVGIDYENVNARVNDEVINMDIFDTSGHQAYLQVRNEFYTNNQAVLLVYDVSNMASFSSLVKWINEITNLKGSETEASCNMVVVGNKAELRKEREVTTDVALTWAKNMDTVTLRFQLPLVMA